MSDTSPPMADVSAPPPGDGSAACDPKPTPMAGATADRPSSHLAVSTLADPQPQTGPAAVPARPQLLSVLMPVYNERRTLRTILRRVLAVPLPLPLEIIAVDDCSRDGSADILRQIAADEPRLRPIFHSANTGKGGAIHTAIAHMRGDVAVIQDADLEYDPADIPRLLVPILDGRADAVFGSRFAAPECRRVLYYWHSVANKFLTWVTNVATDLNLTDMETCYKVVRADILRQTRLRCRRFGLEPELTVRLAQWGARIYEVPVSYSGRTYAEGKKITWRDGLKALVAILWTALIDTRFTTHDGYYILSAVRNATAFNRWMFAQMAPWVGQRVIEAGCGIGNFTELMLDRDQLTALDVDPLYVELVGRRFGHLDNVRIMHADLANPDDQRRLAAETPDTIICLNVLEHIADDLGVLRGFCEALKPGGHAIILVPQHPWLYTGLDETLGHVRRYRTNQLTAVMEKAGLRIVHCQGFNKMGAPGWWVLGKIFGHRHLKPSQMRLFNRLMPLARIIEGIPGWPSLSLIAVGQRPQ